ncbi:MAG: alpha/beta hydrolase [Tardiphaga sp.]
MTTHQPTHAPTFPGERAFDIRLEDGATASVRVYGRGPRIIASHGNGLAIDAFQGFWGAFIPDFETVVFDFRHHGRSSPYQGVAHPWPQLVRDFDMILAGIAGELGPAPSLGAFHSMSALTALLHASDHATPWTGIVAFEPPATPPADHPGYAAFKAVNGTLAERAAKRRTEFPTVEDLVESFRRSPAFAGVDQDAVQALAASSLRWNADRRLFELACAREFEAGIFAMQDLDGAWEKICGVTLPVQIVTGLPPTGGSSGFNIIERALADDGGFGFATIHDATHFMQMEKPAECAALVARFHASLIP